jgi:hypothetical protein
MFICNFNYSDVKLNKLNQTMILFGYGKKVKYINYYQNDLDKLYNLRLDKNYLKIFLYI